MEKMDQLMAEKLTKIMKTAKWSKSHQKNIKQKKKFLNPKRQNFRRQQKQTITR